MANLFKSEINVFQWKNIKPFQLRNQYNELLNIVVNQYFLKQYPTGNLPNFLNTNFCLTLIKFEDKCNCGNAQTMPSVSAVSKNQNTLTREAKDLENAQAEFAISQQDLNLGWLAFELKAIVLTKSEESEVNKLKEAVKQRKEMMKALDATKKVAAPNADLTNVLATLEPLIKSYEDNYALLKAAEVRKNTADYAAQYEINESKNRYEKALKRYEIAQRNFDFEPTKANQQLQADAKSHFETIQNNYQSTASARVAINDGCADKEATYFCLPNFYFLRKMALAEIPKSTTGQDLIDLSFNTNSLTVGSLLWLYYYERMGIFKILGALMDDYNYRGKYTIAGSRLDNKGIAIDYSVLMDMIGNMYRTGISSNQRDRICTYQRVLGVTIENNLGVESEKNAGFMGTFSKLIDYMLEYYKAKQLSQAIQSQTGAVLPRSSVATQTSIRDTMNLLKQQFEPMEYGRNQINTFLGIATVHATLCLVNMVRKEIGIPDQYEKPEEFIPAAYDILIRKRPVTLTETNRFIVYDNCASYGYRLLTDIETADINLLSTIAVGSTLDIWLNDVEGLVEGYRNAYASVPEGVEAIV